MEILEYMKKMQQEGRSEQEMSALLQQSGFSAHEISDALAQTKIKQAVSESADYKMTTSFSSQNQELQQSMMNQSQQPPEPNAEQQNQNSQQQPQYAQEQSQYAQQSPAQEQPMQQQEQYSQQMPMQEYTPQQPQYESYQQYGASSDTMSEIAEQVVAERMSVLKNKIESILELKNSVDIRLSSLNDRLLRIEKIIDRLQLSILQKVGEYVTNVEDIKKEMQETQKSFKSLLSAKESNPNTNYKELE